MSVQAIVDKILKDAETQAEALRGQARQTKAEIEARTEAERTALRERAAHELEKQLAHRRAVLLSQATQANNQSIQAAKRDLVDRVFTEAFAALRDESSDRYVERFTALARHYDIDPEGLTAVVTAPHRTKEAETIVAALGWGSVPIQTDERIAAGLYVQGTQYGYDLTLAGLYAGARGALEIEVARILFSA